jgi:hypothetical protein
MKTLILTLMASLVVIGAQKPDPWAKLPTSAHVDDRREERKVVFDSKRFWDGVDATGLLRRGVNSPSGNVGRATGTEVWMQGAPSAGNGPRAPLDDGGARGCCSNSPDAPGAAVGTGERGHTPVGG